MPHAIIEHSGAGRLTVSDQVLADTVFAAMDVAGLFDSEDIKVRVHPVTASHNGAADYTFVHVDIRIMPGRTSLQKKDCARRVADALHALEGGVSSITVEVNDIDAEVYGKIVV